MEIKFILIAILVGVAQVAKKTGFPARFIPLFNLILGLALAFLLLESCTWQEMLMQGLVVGLSASGLYDNGKMIKGGDDEHESLGGTYHD